MQYKQLCISLHVLITVRNDAKICTQNDVSNFALIVAYKIRCKVGISGPISRITFSLFFLYK